MVLIEYSKRLVSCTTESMFSGALWANSRFANRCINPWMGAREKATAIEATRLGKKSLKFPANRNAA